MTNYNIQGQGSATFVSETNANPIDDINTTISSIASFNVRKRFNEYKEDMSYLGDSCFDDALLSCKYHLLFLLICLRIYSKQITT